ncbi:MAG TPA: hypothetical protein VGF94_21990 [Kofleriaceae bacterium]|jgi:hypothetical protein
MIVQSRQAPPPAAGADEALSLRLRDLALVELEALCAGVDGARAAQLVGAFAEDVADALREARIRLAALRAQLAGPDPLNVLDAAPRQRASDAGVAGAARVRDRLSGQADAARAFARLAELAAGLVPKLFEAERRR